MSEAPSSWVSTSQAAAALGVSERTVQRRAAAGKLEARKVCDDEGERWEIALSLPTGDDTGRVNSGATVPTSADRVMAPGASVKQDSGANDVGTVPTGVPTGGVTHENKVTPQVTTGDDTSRSASAAPDFTAHLIEENRFLRNLLEQRDRDAAELRAALREALRAMPKQLPTGDSAPGDTASGSTNQATASTQKHQRETAPEVAQRVEKPRESPPERRGDALALVREGLRKLFSFKKIS